MCILQCIIQWMLPSADTDSGLSIRLSEIQPASMGKRKPSFQGNVVSAYSTVEMSLKIYTAVETSKLASTL